MRLGAPNYKNNIAFRNGSNNDIISTLHKALPQAVKEVATSAEQFRGANNTETARNIWNYLRKELKYKKDPNGYQFIKLPRRLTTVKNGDCKSYSLLAASILSALKMPVIFRYGAYNTELTPSHVYVITKDENGNEIIIDGVYNYFNKEVPYFKKYDYPMNIQVLSGVMQQTRFLQPSQRKRIKITLETLRNNQPAGSFAFALISNRILARDKQKNPIRYNAAQLANYSNMLRARIKAPNVRPTIKRFAAAELEDIQSGNFYGFIPFITENAQISGIQQEIGLSFKKLGKGFSKLGKGVKKGLKKVSLKNIARGLKAVGLLVPRKAFLALVALNVRGIAARLSKASPDKVAKLWFKFGGKSSVLASAINKGKTRKPIFGGGRIKAVSGIGYVYYGENEPMNGIGEPMSIGATLAAAAPVVIAFMKFLKGEGIPEPAEEGATEEGVESEVMENGGGSVIDNIKTFGKNAYDIVASTGIIPERNLAPVEQRVNEEVKGDDFEKDPTEPKKLPILPIALGVGALLLVMMSKKRK